MRTCQIDTCISPVFGTDKNTGIGYCKNHQSKRTDLKAKAKSSGIAKRSPKKTLRSIPSFGFESQPDLFAWCWENQKTELNQVICKYTGINLKREFKVLAEPNVHDTSFVVLPTQWLNCFAHVLPKKNYTYFRLNPKNIRVVYPEFHRIVDQGSSVDRANHPEWRFDLWDQEVEKMKIEYKLFKKQNLLP